jgi:hypothetical protein
VLNRRGMEQIGIAIVELLQVFRALLLHRNQ